MPACHLSWHFLYFIFVFSSYWALSVVFVPLVAGAVIGVSGKASGAVVSIGSPLSNFESESLKLPFIATLESKIRTTNMVANVQVLLSKKSPVFFTPPTTWLPLKA